MCIILTDGLIPAATELATLRAAEDQFPPLKSFVTIYRNRASMKEGTRQLMIVPFPQPRRDAELKDFRIGAPASAKQEEYLFVALRRAFPQITSTRSLSMLDSDMSNSPKVRQVGGYKITMATRFEQLLNVPWSQFTLPDNFEALQADLQRRFGHGFGFVVVEPSRHPETGQVGGTFAWLWHGEHAMLPTAHEMAETRRGEPLQVEYDVTGWIVDRDVPEKGRAVWMSSDEPLQRSYLSMHVPNATSRGSRLDAHDEVQEALGTDVFQLAPFSGIALRVRLSGKLDQNDHVAWVTEGATAQIPWDTKAQIRAGQQTEKQQMNELAERKGIMKGLTSSGPAAAATPGSPKRPWWTWLLVALAVIGLVGLSYLLWRSYVSSKAKASLNGPDEIKP